MASKAFLTAKIISQAESYHGIRAGMARLKDVSNGPSYRAARQGPESTDHAREVDWPVQARTVLILGLKHPEEDPHLDYWEQGDSWGNRRLREISKLLKRWLREQYDLIARPLPYQVEKGGLFLKDAAVLSGIGIIGRNNLVLHPQWGPRIRLRAILLEAELQTTHAVEDFHPCETCQVFCQKVCPMKAFPQKKYSRQICLKQMNADEENEVAEGEVGANGKRNMVIKYCRACELSCPVGA